LVPTLWLLSAQLAQQVDPSNTALKAPGTKEAANRRKLAEVVPSEQVILLSFAERGDQRILPEDEARITALAERLAARNGVVAVEAPPAPQPSLSLRTVYLAPDADLGSLADEIVADARREGPPSLQFAATGLPLLEAKLATLVTGERATLVPMLGVTLLGLAWLLYRRIGLAIAAVAPALLAIVLTGGTIARLGYRLDPVAALLDPVLLTIGVATCVHMVEAWRAACAAGEDAALAARTAARRILTPTLLATGTTVVGLLSLTTNAVPAVADFGVRAAFGLGVLHATVFTVLPVLLGALRPPQTPMVAPAALGRGWLAGLECRRLPILSLAVTMSVLAVAALPRLQADNDPLALVPSSEPSRAAYDALAGRLGGVETCHLLAPAGTPAADPSRLLPFVASLQLEPGIGGIAGPPVRTEAGDLAVPLLLAPAGSGMRTRLFQAIERGATARGLDGLVPAGLSVQIARDSDRLVSSLLLGTMATVVLLGVGMCLGLRSLRLGLLSLVPTVMPCIWVYGALAALGRPVSVATGMIACTMLGLLIDNAAHFLHRYAAVRHSSATGREAVLSALRHVGRPMLLSSSLLIAGFATAATSRLSTTVEFAVLACSTIALALLATAVLLPLLLAAPSAEVRHEH
jgi:predicted RND superfamily exporter protein